MKQFAQLLERLVLTPSRNKKIDYMADYFRTSQSPDRGYVLAALCSELDIKNIKSGIIKKMVMKQCDEFLFKLSYDYVGDLAETISLMWEETDNTAKQLPTITAIIQTLNETPKTDALKMVEEWLNIATPNERWALIKLITGGLRVGVSARLAKTFLSHAFDTPLEEIEKIWHGLKPPYKNLFDWLEGAAEKPVIDPSEVFHPMMLSHPIDKNKDFIKLNPDEFSAEWKWDGIRVQLNLNGDNSKIFSRTGDDISHSFPDIIENSSGKAILDGELLVGEANEPAREGLENRFTPYSFNDLQQRLNRKTVVKKHLKELPAYIRVYDILFLDGTDLRDLPLIERQQKLSHFLTHNKNPRLDLSTTLPFKTWQELAQKREEGAHKGIEGVMIKLKTSPYIAGRPKGPWFKWKRDPLLADAILMYAQRGHGKRSSFYSDYTFGVWRGNEIVPIGKAYFGFTDAELKQIDKWVRKNTIQKFGPVREVSKDLVFEVAFDSVHKSNRHKSGLALRFPRIHRIRWDKPAQEADHIEMVEKLIE